MHSVILIEMSQGLNGKGSKKSINVTVIQLVEEHW